MSTKFSAHAQALGYLYQVRYALLLLLKSEDYDSQIYVEKLDDIEFDQDGTSSELIQMKHHSKEGNLTDSSSDVWKTLRVWSEAILDEHVDPSTTKFSLITNQVASENTASSKLTFNHEFRDVEGAQSILTEIAATSNSDSNKKSYEQFKALSPYQQRALLKNTYVLDCSENIIETEDSILYQLRLTARPEVIKPLFERLEGIWFDKVIKHLKSESMYPLTFREIQDNINDLQEQLQRDNLPIDFHDLIAPNEEELSSKERVFVEQLKLVSVGNSRIEKAISDYYKAFQQRSKWVRDELILIDELESYENRLIDEWERKFEIIKEDSGDEESDIAIRKEGRGLFNWVEQENNIQIRPKCDEPYIIRGSYHMLSNQLKVGWHMQFYERLKHLLSKSLEERV
ncbi:ABC-three component system protein [Salisediminibacterium halotolerans]|uniref:CD-NTase associated protein 4-like DNA endonuclease domain-containing protein n=1 Tax=Salisediminibacterium halotolerans TaxID=517425 RepID=A0A1H9T1L7_9BACI|nr:ABC-three component system protein [Salisediminibacterium haloalkalitolerans]SER90967.1 hypothetical protein SAMN05444126_10898 [Salisediminibacterium haloalkalitolerans]